MITVIFLFFNSTSSKNIPAVESVETRAENKNSSADIETPAPDSNLEKLQPLPNNPALENFQPFFQTIQQYNFELKMNAQNLGGVQLGDSLETVNEILGDAEEMKIYDGLNFKNYFYKNLNVTIENNVVTVITTKNSEVETLKGIRQGDSLKVVLRHTATTFKRSILSTSNDSFSAELRFTKHYNGCEFMRLNNR